MWISDGENNTSQKLRKSFDDTLRELIVHQYSTIMKSVGCLMSHNGKGTIFRVGSKYGMTAAHVVNAIISKKFKMKFKDYFYIFPILLYWLKIKLRELNLFVYILHWKYFNFNLPTYLSCSSMWWLKNKGTETLLFRIFGFWAKNWQFTGLYL